MTIQINGTTGISGVDGSAGTPSLKGSDTDTGISFATDVIIASTGGTERFRCDSSGRMLVGTSSARSNFENSTTSPQIQIESTTLNGASLSILRHNNDAGGPKLFLAHGRTGAGLVSNGDELGGLFFSGGDGSEFVTSASVTAAVDGTPGADDMPGRLVFSTTADGASSPTERMRIANNGAISTVVPGGSTLYPAYDCRAWVNFNGTGVVAIRASGNVSSITDNGTGDYTVNFTTAISDANYSVVATNIGSVNVNQRSFAASSNNALATGSCRMVLVQDSGALNDQDTVSVAIFR